MTVIVDGYKLYTAREKRTGILHHIAGIGQSDVIARAKARGVEVDESSIGWHDAYRGLACVRDDFDRKYMMADLEDAIVTDVAEYP